MGTNLHDRDISHNFTHQHYCSSLKKDLTECFQYVKRVEQRFNIYSDEFAQIILLAANKFKNSLKELIALMEKTSRGNLWILRESLIGEFPSSIKMEFCISRYEILLILLRGWEAGGKSWLV